LRTGAVYAVAPRRARALAGALRRRGLLEFAEPDRAVGRRAFPQDPAFAEQPLLAVVDPALSPPAPSPAGPLLAVLDAQVAPHPELATGLSLLHPTAPVTEWHGTAVASVAGAAADGRGMVGVLPGARLLGVDTPARCSGSATAIEDAVTAGARVLNMSYGGPPCYAEYLATQLAAHRGAVLVAAGGNELLEGNRPAYPASYPHVVTVASVGRSGRPSAFSNENPGVDLAAPGERVLVAVPPALDPRGPADGYAQVDGTSFAAPMVAGAAAWVRAVRPALLPDQVASVLRRGSRDLGPRGWDPATGHGLLRVGGALRAEPEAPDPREPDDDVPLVDGTWFGEARPPLLGPGERSRTVRGRLDQWEDPSDVVRVVVPARGALRVAVRPRAGDPDLAVFSAAARTIDRRRGLLARSLRGAGATDAVRIANPARRRRVVFVAVYIDGSVRRLDAAYGLTVSR
ncbi:MAG: S8 family serine peptidase, partial [Actinomycetota bacterium]|nr:S8 family serine peptidase [Actinomycetota bacterium]